MTLKYIFQRIKSFLHTQLFLLLSCLVVFCLSIFLRSRVDIGADSGVYIDIAKKILEGKRYYYEIYESNFPLSFYFYALERLIAEFFNVSAIILSEIVINILGVFSVFCSYQILKKSDLFKDKIEINILIIGFSVGFFLRACAMEIAEFGTKTSLVLILLYPYLAYCISYHQLSKSQSIKKGILMGLIPCIKPHYLIYILFIESYKFFQNKNIKFFCEIDKIIMLSIGVSYLAFMWLYEVEFFKFIVWMWPNNYSSYSDVNAFLEKIFLNFANKIAAISLMFVMFSRIKLDEISKILIVIYIASAVLLLLENASTFDQIALYFAVTSPVVFVLFYRFVMAKDFVISEVKFIFASLFLISLLDYRFIQVIVFLPIANSILWSLALLLYLGYLKYKYPREITYSNLQKLFGLLLLIFLCSLILLKFDINIRHSFSYLSLLLVLFLFEKQIFIKISDKFSKISSFIVISAFCFIFFAHIEGIMKNINDERGAIYPNKYSDFIHYYSKKYAALQDENITILANSNFYKYPIIQYLDKTSHAKYSVSVVDASNSKDDSSEMFNKDFDNEKLFTLLYLYNDTKNQILNEKNNLVFVNTSQKNLNSKTKCQIGYLEYYFLDEEFKKYFLQNYQFVNRFINYNQNNKLIHDFEVYKRK